MTKVEHTLLTEVWRDDKCTHMCDIREIKRVKEAADR